MGFILNKEVINSSINGIKKENCDIYFRPVNISIDTNICTCNFWLEGRRKNIHGEIEILEQYTIEIDKKKDIFTQIYNFLKSIDKYQSIIDV